MERSVEYRLPLKGSRPWIREVPTTATPGEGPRIAFKLLLGFLLLLYSSVAVIYKSLEPFRPVALMAVAAIFMMFVELGQARRRFQLMWPQGFLLLAFVALAFIASFDAMWARLAFDRTGDLAKIILIYVLIENTATSERRIHAVCLTMVCCGLIPAIGVIDHYARGILIEGSRGAWRGLFSNPNEAAYGLLVLLPLALTIAIRAGWVLRVVMTFAMLVMLVAIFITYSRGGLLGLLVVVGLIAWKQKSLAIRSLMGVGLIGALFVGGLYWNRNQGIKDISSDTTFNQRITTIKAGLRMFEAHPLLGVGPGCSIVAYPLYVPPESNGGGQPQLVIHNSFIQVLSEVGIPGFVVFMMLLGSSLWDAWRLQKGPLAPYAGALEIALWGCIACSLSGGFVYTWWPYIFIGLIAAAKHASDGYATEGTNAAV